MFSYGVRRPLCALFRIRSEFYRIRAKTSTERLTPKVRKQKRRALELSKTYILLNFKNSSLILVQSPGSEIWTKTGFSPLTPIHSAYYVEFWLLTGLIKNVKVQIVLEVLSNIHSVTAIY